MQEELPNGFTGFSNRRPGFESAGEAMRKAAAAAELNTDVTDYKRSATKAARLGWQTASEEHAADSNLWATYDSGDPFDMKSYLRVPNVHSSDTGLVLNEEALSEISETDRRWSWVEIELPAIRNNVLAVRGIIPEHTMIMAVVKADAYGHGAVQCARTAVNSGAEYLGVATVDEGIELRKNRINAPILLLAEPPIKAIPLLLAYKIMPTICTVEFAIRYAEAADSIGQRAPYHLKINTGMNRIGVRFNEVVPFLRQIAFHRALNLVGTFTHFATADCHDTLEFDRQVARFEEALYAMATDGIDPGIVHAANSAAIIRYPQVHYDMVRLGISLYGFYPGDDCYGTIDLIPAMSVHARITDVKTVPLGEGVSYGLHYRSSGYSKICTVPIGYGDGLRRGLSDRTNFIMNGTEYPQVGNICMDQCMFEVDPTASASLQPIEPQHGDEVIIVGAQGNSFVTIDEMARKLGTIQHEIAIGFGNTRLPRIYK